MRIYRESIQQFDLKHHTIRVWREAQKGSIIAKHDEDVSIMIAGMCKDEPPEDLSKLAGTLLEMDRVNAVEVKDKAGNGLVIYKDWP